MAKRKGTTNKNELWYLHGHGRAGKRISKQEAAALLTLIKKERGTSDAGFFSAADKVLKANGYTEIKKTKTRRKKKR
jgi:hypothetical protein